MKTGSLLLRVFGSVVVVFVVINWLGFKVSPKSYPPYTEPNCSVPVSRLPTDLPAPVNRYFSVLFGPTYRTQEVPVLEPAVVTGRGSVVVAGIRAPTLFQAYYGGHATFRRAVDITWFGIRISKAIDSYHDGNELLQKAGSTASGQKIAQAENLAYWSEAVWIPSVFVRNERVRWEVVDEVTARLVVPFGKGEDSLLVKFDPQSGLIQSMSAQRFRSAQAQEKTAWRVDYRNWQSYHEVKVPTELLESWGEERTPSDVLTTEYIEYGVHGFLTSHLEYLRALVPSG